MPPHFLATTFTVGFSDYLRKGTQLFLNIAIYRCATIRTDYVRQFNVYAPLICYIQSQLNQFLWTINSHRLITGYLEVIPKPRLLYRRSKWNDKEISKDIQRLHRTPRCHFDCH